MKTTAPLAHRVLSLWGVAPPNVKLCACGHPKGSHGGGEAPWGVRRHPLRWMLQVFGGEPVSRCLLGMVAGLGLLVLLLGGWLQADFLAFRRRWLASTEARR